jgi:hypothetical protein
VITGTRQVDKRVQPLSADRQVAVWATVDDDVE